MRDERDARTASYKKRGCSARSMRKVKKDRERKDKRKIEREARSGRWGGKKENGRKK